MAKVVVIIPTYNEAKGTPEMIETLVGIIPTIPDHQVSVLYVDDSSPDGTAEIVKRSQKKYSWLKLLVNPKKAGLGAAYAAGMTYAMHELKADYLMEFDSDFQHPPQDIPRLIAEINHGFDYILASRYISGGSIPQEWGFTRKFISVVGNLVARICLILPRIHDVTGGFKLSKVKGFMDQFDFSTLISKRFAYKIQLLFYMVKKGARVKEVPIHFAPRTSGESKLPKNEMQETLRVIFLLQLHNPKIQSFFKFGVVGFTGLAINLFFLNVFNRLLISQPIPVGVVNFLANAMAAELAIISNFIFNNLWTFSTDKITGPGKLLSKFITFNLSSVFSGILVPSTAIGIGTQIFGNHTRNIFLFLFLFGFTIPFNWFIYNKFIWKTSAKKAAN